MTVQAGRKHGGTVRYVYDGADRPVCRLEEDRIKT